MITYSHPDQVSLKNYIYNKASAHKTWFTKSDIDRWTKEYGKLVDRFYYVESACRRCRELAETGLLKMTRRGVNPSVALYKINR